MRVALVHYWLVAMRGGEKVLENLIDIFPDCEIFTHFADPTQLSEKIRSRPIRTTFIAKLPFAKRHFRAYLPLMPLALENLDLRDFDVVITSESGPAKGVITTPHTLHVCYCHSPMRYLWNMYHEYRDGAGALTAAAMGPLSHYLRMWDFASAQRVDHFVANSTAVARRIEKYYRRDATVIYPPVQVDSFYTSRSPSDAFLCVGQLVRYKRVDLAIRAFNEMKKPLVVIGEGEEFAHLASIAGPTIKLMGHQPDSVVREQLSMCRALIFSGEEDFGIVPVEAMASGRPVIAFGRGGARDTVVDGVTGLLFHEQTVTGLIDAVRRFESMARAFDPQALVRHAYQFRPEVFRDRVRRYVYGKYEALRQGPGDTVTDEPPASARPEIRSRRPAV
jgi:glycosyltransferase involved in cell wall biosynthesis